MNTAEPLVLVERLMHKMTTICSSWFRILITPIFGRYNLHTLSSWFSVRDSRILSTGLIRRLLLIREALLEP